VASRARHLLRGVVVAGEKKDVGVLVLRGDGRTYQSTSGKISWKKGVRKRANRAKERATPSPREQKSGGGERGFIYRLEGGGCGTAEGEPLQPEKKSFSNRTEGSKNEGRECFSIKVRPRGGC